MRTDKRASQKSDKKAPLRANKRGVVGYSKKSALLEEAITHMNTGKYGRSSAALKELLALDPQNTEARRLFATLHLRLGSLVTARQAFESLATEAIGRQDYWLAESLLREYLAAGPRCVPFLELLAHVYQEKGDEMAAVGELGKAVEIIRDDPDTENPHKAAQLYAKIRELAPGSPVAIQLASLFDVRTGEFLVRSSIADQPSAVHDATASTPASVDSIAMESTPAEIMPWELGEEPVTGVEAPSSSVATPTEFKAAAEPSLPVELPEGEPAIGLQELPSQPFESVSAGQGQVVAQNTTSHGQEEPAAQPLLQSPPESTAELGNALSSPMPWEQVSDGSIQIPEAGPSSSATPDSSIEAILSSLKEGTESPLSAPALIAAPESVLDPAPVIRPMESPSSDGSVAVPPSVRDEQVVDASISVQDIESLPDQTPAVSMESILSDLRTNAEEPSPPYPYETPPVQAEDPVPEPIPIDQLAAIEALPSHFVLPEPASSTESSQEAPPSSSFSWTSVFDTAWKFAAGTTAPSAPASCEHTQETIGDAQQNTPLQESDSASAGSASIVSDIPLTVDLPPTVGSTSQELDPFSYLQTNQPVSEGSTNREDALADASPSATSVVTDSVQSYPMPTESTAADLPEFLSRSPIDEAPQAQAPAAIPASFSAVVDAQEIPEAELARAEPPESSVSFEIASPEPSFVAPSPSTPLEEPFQPVGMTAHMEEAPSKSEPTTPPVEVPSHWNTGEVAVQLHRPAAKKKRWEKDPDEAAETSAIPAPALETLSEELSEAIREWKSAPLEAVSPSVAEEPSPSQPDPRPEWMQASEDITFARPHATPREQWQPASSGSFSRPAEQASAPTVTSSAVDVLFGSTGRAGYGETQDRPASTKPRPRFIARLHRIRIGVSSFVGSCFSTTRSLTFLAMAIAATTGLVAALGVGALGLVWMAMEDPPSVLHQGLTITPPRVIADPKKNGYLLLLGLEALPGQDPVQAGYERKAGEQDLAMSRACMGGDDANEGNISSSASGHVVKGWFRSANPVAQLKGQSETIKSLAAREASSLARYRQWLTMPFEDWGYGQLLSPNCTQVLLVHRLFLSEGFAQDSGAGLDRLETDMQAWRTALGQSKTLMMKMLAVAAVQDDVALASGLLSRSELDGTSVTRLSKMVRPLDQVELSVRWPMQSQFVWATKSVPAELKHDKSNDRPWYVSLIAGMRLPVQRRANAYAEYYEAANKAVAEGRYTNLPKPSSFLRVPATGLMDYLINPVENIVGIEPLPSWDPYVMRMIETDAQFRLAGLQAWIRRGPQDGDLLTRLAKAGQAYYDPFTGLPMLVNQRQGLIYSVGRDGKDQEGDRTHDVAVVIPSASSSSSENKRSTSAPSPR